MDFGKLLVQNNMDKYSENYSEKIMEYTEKEKNEIRNDRKILDMILEKYGKDDVMQFLDTDFDDNDNGNYFDTFNQADNLEKYFYDISIAAEEMYNNINNHFVYGEGIREKSTTEFVGRWNSFISFIIDTYNNMKKTAVDRELLKTYAETAYLMTII